jgi:ATP-dependent Lhr-like helicase
VETLADILNRLAQESEDPLPLVLAHHGSLPKELREAAEAALKSGRSVIVLATSSLELGIDLGSIYRVIQIDPTWTISSLRQRMGRSGRMEGQPSRLLLCVRDSLPIREVSLTASLFPNLLRSVALVRLLLRGIVEPADGHKLHLSTLVHQVLSAVRQWGAIEPGKLHQLLCGAGPFRKVDPPLFVDILRSLKGHDLIGQDSSGSVVLGRQGERITDDYHFFAAFVTRDEFTVRWNEASIGLIPASELPKPGQHIILAGRRWRVDKIHDRTKLIDVTPAETGAPPVFLGDKGDVHDLVVAEMWRVLADTEIPPYLDSKASELLTSARASAQRAGLLKARVLHGGSQIVWFPWRGTRCLLTLRLHATSAGIKCLADDLALTYPGLSLEQFRLHLQRIASDQEDPARLASFMDQKHFQKFDEYLDAPILNRTNANDRLDLPSAQDAAAIALAELETTPLLTQITSTAGDSHADSK